MEERTAKWLFLTTYQVVESVAAVNMTNDESTSLAFGYMADSDCDRQDENDEMKRQGQ